MTVAVVSKPKAVGVSNCAIPAGLSLLGNAGERFNARDDITDQDDRFTFCIFVTIPEH